MGKLFKQGKEKMKHIQQVLDRSMIPETLKAVQERINLLCDTMQTLQDCGEKTQAMDGDHDALLALWWFAELQNNERHVQEANEGFPSTDPLTMLKVAEQYKILPADEASKLRVEFMKRASAAAGHHLTEKQVKKLYELFRSYNPVRHMQPDEPKP